MKKFFLGCDEIDHRELKSSMDRYRVAHKSLNDFLKWVWYSNESSHAYKFFYAIQFLKVGGHCVAMFDVIENTLSIFKSICMNFSLELNFLF